MSITVQPAPDEQSRVADIVERTRRRFPSVDLALVAEVVHDAYREYGLAGVGDLPSRVEKRACEVLDLESRWVEA